MPVVAQPLAAAANAPWRQYGSGNTVMETLLGQYGASSPIIEFTEVFGRSPMKTEVQTVTDIAVLEHLLDRAVPADQILRVISVSQLSAPTIQLLGSKMNMDYELWSNRLQSSDREWFAGPYHERGAKEYSHFNLACVDFQRATAMTPEEFKDSRRLGHTVRLIRLIDTANSATVLPRIFVLRRISGHLRRDNKLWTFIYFNDPYIDMSAAHYASDVPGSAQQPLRCWLTDFLNANTPEALLQELGDDGFGFVYRILREIKSTWKLLLNEMEYFLESLTEDASDDQLMDAAPWLHRRFLLNIDYFQHQLRYHVRYVNYLRNAPLQKGLCIVPTIFKRELQQENDALDVVEKRLSALRDRTSSVLETVLNINTIKQAKLAAEMTKLQREDARVTIAQGEVLKRLTLLNMVYLPPTFVATLFSINSASSWPLKAFIGVALAFLCVTMVAAWTWREPSKEKTEKTASANDLFHKVGQRLRVWRKIQNPGLPIP